MTDLGAMTIPERQRAFLKAARRALRVEVVRVLGGLLILLAAIGLPRMASAAADTAPIGESFSAAVIRGAASSRSPTSDAARLGESFRPAPGKVSQDPVQSSESFKADRKEEGK